MATKLVPSSSDRETHLHSGENWELLCPVFLTCALRKSPEIHNKRHYLLPGELVKGARIAGSLGSGMTSHDLQ